MASIVSTETSAVTFISVPGYAFSTDFTFLQLPLGYVVGRFVVSLLFVPAYFRGEVLTVYQLLGDRFGGAVKQLASGLFLVTRTLSDGFRLFATSLVLGALFMALPGAGDAAGAWLPGADPAMGLLVASVVVLGAAMIVYTFLGGMTALIWTDVIQLGIYLVGAGAAIVVLLQNIPGGVGEVMNVATAQGKLHVLDFALRRHARLHLLVRCHRRRIPDHRDARHRPVHGAAVPLQPLTRRRAQGAAGQRRVRAGAVLHLSGHRPAALRLLHGPCRHGAWRHHGWRPCADRPCVAAVHRDPSAGGARGPGRRRRFSPRRCPRRSTRRPRPPSATSTCRSRGSESRSATT